MPRRIRGQAPRRRTYLKEWREHRDMTLEQAAAKFDMSSAQLSRIENTLSPYTQDLLELAAHIYRTDTFSLLFRHPSDSDTLSSAIAEIVAGRHANR